MSSIIPDRVRSLKLEIESSNPYSTIKDCDESLRTFKEKEFEEGQKHRGALLVVESTGKELTVTILTGGTAFERGWERFKIIAKHIFSGKVFWYNPEKYLEDKINECADSAIKEIRKFSEPPKEGEEKGQRETIYTLMGDVIWQDTIEQSTFAVEEPEEMGIIGSFKKSIERGATKAKEVVGDTLANLASQIPDIVPTYIPPGKVLESIHRAVDANTERDVKKGIERRMSVAPYSYDLNTKKKIVELRGARRDFYQTYWKQEKDELDKTERLVKELGIELENAKISHKEASKFLEKLEKAITAYRKANIDRFAFLFNEDIATLKRDLGARIAAVSTLLQSQPEVLEKIKKMVESLEICDLKPKVLSPYISQLQTIYDEGRFTLKIEAPAKNIIKQKIEEPDYANSNKYRKKHITPVITGLLEIDKFRKEARDLYLNVDLNVRVNELEARLIDKVNERVRKLFDFVDLNIAILQSSTPTPKEKKKALEDLTAAYQCFSDQYTGLANDKRFAEKFSKHVVRWQGILNQKISRSSGIVNEQINRKESLKESSSKIEMSIVEKEEKIKGEKRRKDDAYTIFLFFEDVEGLKDELNVFKKSEAYKILGPKEKESLVWIERIIGYASGPEKQKFKKELAEFYGFKIDLPDVNDLLQRRIKNEFGKKDEHLESLLSKIMKGRELSMFGKLKKHIDGYQSAIENFEGQKKEISDLRRQKEGIEDSLSYLEACPEHLKVAKFEQERIQSWIQLRLTFTSAPMSTEQSLDVREDGSRVADWFLFSNPSSKLGHDYITRVINSRSGKMTEERPFAAIIHREQVAEGENPDLCVGFYAAENEAYQASAIANCILNARGGETEGGKPKVVRQPKRTEEATDDALRQARRVPVEASDVTEDNLHGIKVVDPFSVLPAPISPVPIPLPAPFSPPLPLPSAPLAPMPPGVFNKGKKVDDVTS